MQRNKVDFTRKQEKKEMKRRAPLFAIPNSTNYTVDEAAREKIGLGHDSVRVWPQENRTSPSFFYFLGSTEADGQAWVREKQL
jgi:hypothetical protein